MIPFLYIHFFPLSMATPFLRCHIKCTRAGFIWLPQAWNRGHTLKGWKSWIKCDVLKKAPVCLVSRFICCCSNRILKTDGTNPEQQVTWFTVPEPDKSKCMVASWGLGRGFVWETHKGSYARSFLCRRSILQGRTFMA